MCLAHMRETPASEILENVEAGLRDGVGWRMLIGATLGPKRRAGHRRPKKRIGYLSLIQSKRDKPKRGEKCLVRFRQFCKIHHLLRCHR